MNSFVEQFRALGDPTRFKLIQLISHNRGLCVSELAGRVDVTPAGVSQQLKLLEQAGLIIRKRTGQKICYEISDADQTRRLLELIDRESVTA